VSRSWSSPTTWPGVVALLRHGSSDSAWTAVVADLCGDVLEGLPLIVGGRSARRPGGLSHRSGYRRPGVLCLAFPLQPPRRASAPAATSRLPELDAVIVPTLVVQGRTRPLSAFLRSEDPELRRTVRGRMTAAASIRSRCGYSPSAPTEGLALVRGALADAPFLPM
jgi:hypothetical protein